MNNFGKTLQWLRVYAAFAALLCQPQAMSATSGLNPAKVTQPCIQGAYIQLVNKNGSWDKSMWRALFDNFHNLHIENLVIQWSVYDQMAFYRSQRFSTVNTVPLETILDLADEAGMRVMIGLSHDPAFWENIAKNDKRPYLMERLQTNMSAASELIPLATMHKSFAGWYISEEVDDLNWRRADDREALFSYLQQLSTFLRISSLPQAKIGLSIFANSQTPPSEVELFWTDLLTRVSSLDKLYFQDGIGVGKLNFNNVGRYYQAIKNAARITKRDFTPVIEVFEQTSGAPMTDAKFTAAPATLQRLIRQIEIAKQYSPHRVAFGIPEYMTPNGGEPAGALYNEYLDATEALRTTTCNAGQ